LLVAQLRTLSPADAERLATGFWSGRRIPDYLSGLDLFLADVASKGFVNAVPVVRKDVRWSLLDATAVLTRACEDLLTKRAGDA
jgi:hypothetical protein